MTRAQPPRRRVAIIGSGPAGLMAAEVASRTPDTEVTIYEAMPSPGRKLLMAGRGGLNLTHSESIDMFMTRYGGSAPALAPYIDAFSPLDARAWCEQLGEPTFVGTSGRVFPKAMKASGLLRSWLRRLDRHGVKLLTRHRWTGWDHQSRLTFTTASGHLTVDADATVLALGGASWPRLGSDGAWTIILAEHGLKITPLRPANAGLIIPWSEHFRSRFEGQPIKNIAIRSGETSTRGDAVVTGYGLEGGPVYAISAIVRDQLGEPSHSTITIDLKPDTPRDALARSIARPRGKQSFSNHLRKAIHLSPVAIALLQEATRANGLNLTELSAEALADLVRSVPLSVSGVASLERSISTAGGLSFDELDDQLMLRKHPGVFATGEMLDWEAPTGGYLLQACLATGAAAGRSVVRWLDRR